MSSWPPNDEYKDFRNALEQGCRAGDITAVRSLVTQQSRPPWFSAAESLRDVFKRKVELAAAQDENDESLRVVCAVLREWRDEPGVAEPSSQDLVLALDNAIIAGNPRTVKELMQNSAEIYPVREVVVAAALESERGISFEVLNILVDGGWKVEESELLQYVLRWTD
jgi:hypothetical protein